MNLTQDQRDFRNAVMTETVKRLIILEKLSALPIEHWAFALLKIASNDTILSSQLEPRKITVGIPNALSSAKPIE